MRLIVVNRTVVCQKEVQNGNRGAKYKRNQVNPAVFLNILKKSIIFSREM